MKNIQKQKGVGMVEVLVALLLLAVGVLGYVALQFRAVDASSEALASSQAILIMRGLTESIRVNTMSQGDYPAAVRGYAGYTSNTVAPTPNCLSVNCTPAQLATYDAYQSAKAAFAIGVNITMADCPGVAASATRRQCLFGAWGDTRISATSFSNCMSDTGIYVPQAKCLMMEAY